MAKQKAFGVVLKPAIAQEFNDFLKNQSSSRNLLINKAIAHYLKSVSNQKPPEAA